MGCVYSTENGRLSYENPNYQLHLNAVRLEDALNSNTEHFNLNSALLSYSMDVLSPQLSNMVPVSSKTKVIWMLTNTTACVSLQDLGMELELARTGSSTSLSGGNATRQRRHYASLDPTSMGVDVEVGPVMNLGSPDFDNNRYLGQRAASGVIASPNFVYVLNRGVLNNYDSSVDAAGQRKSVVERQGTDSSSADMGSPSASESSATATACDSEPERSEEELPPGWEKHEGTTSKASVAL